MKFGPIPSAEAAGAILAHSLMVGDRAFKKGRVLSAEDVAALTEAGIAEIVGARVEAGEVTEDLAATALAEALAGPGVTVTAAFTGRANLYAAETGLAVIDSATIDRLNRIDEGLTVATLQPFEQVEPRQMVATVKIIPFSIPQGGLDQALDLVRAAAGPVISARPFVPGRAGLVQTRLPQTKQSVIDKTVAVVGARLEALGSQLAEHQVVGHDSAAVAAALRRFAAAGLSPLMVIGASATTDRRDVVPAAVVEAGGTVQHYGMPVDPGNLLLIGTLGRTPVIGLPGCARSPKYNGFDMVLQRLAAGLEVAGRDIQALGVGGLLGEIGGRPQPRDSRPAAPHAPRLGAIVLAAGRSSRMGETNKLTLPWANKPMVCHPIDAALEAGLDPVVVVTGHQAERVEALFAGRPVSIVHNPRYAEGLATSLRAGLRALPYGVDGAAILLGDMPRVTPDHLRRLAAAFAPDEGRAIIVPTRNGRWGNPLVWGRRFFEEIGTLIGDRGARSVAETWPDLVAEVAMADDGVLMDLDTPEALRAAESQT